jgi:hypothetical protein|tara:strand:- start:115 stop:360 length:246 start_codon:yes stop_codon:yes gene_type:complete
LSELIIRTGSQRQFVRAAPDLLTTEMRHQLGENLFEHYFPTFPIRHYAFKQVIEGRAMVVTLRHKNGPLDNVCAEPNERER